MQTCVSDPEPRLEHGTLHHHLNGIDENWYSLLELTCHAMHRQQIYSLTH